MKKITNVSRWFFGAALFLTSLVPLSTPAEEVGDPSCLAKDPPPPVVKLKLRVPACSEPGQAIQYRMCVENCSASEAHHVVVKNVVPANAKFVKADPEPTKQGGELQWHLGTIGGGASREITLWLAPTNRDDVKNCARVVFEHGLCVVTRQSAHPGSFPFDPTKPFDPLKPPIVKPVPEVTTEEMPVLDLSFRGPREQYANLASRYEITVTNKGKGKATNAQISCKAADRLKIVSASKPGAVDENVVAWKLGDLAPGASQVVELTLKATSAGDYCFKATAEADLGVKKEAEFCTKFIGVSALSVDMKDLVDPVFLGEKTSFPIVIKSLGSAAVTGIQVKAFVPDGLKLERTTPLFDRREPRKGGDRGEWIEFVVVPKIDAGEQARYEIFVEATQAGRRHLRILVSADQLDSTRPVVWDELTTIVDDRAK